MKNRDPNIENLRPKTENRKLKTEPRKPGKSKLNDEIRNPEPEPEIPNLPQGMTRVQISPEGINIGMAALDLSTASATSEHVAIHSVSMYEPHTHVLHIYMHIIIVFVISLDYHIIMVCYLCILCVYDPYNPSLYSATSEHVAIHSVSLYEPYTPYRVG